MRVRIPLVAAVVLTIALITANVSVGQAQEGEYLIGKVISLQTYATSAPVAEILTAGQHLMVNVPPELFVQLSVGDTLVLTADGAWYPLFTVQETGPKNPK